MGVLSEDEYLKKNNYITVSTGTNFVKNEGRSVDLEQKYKQVSQVI
jgi:hypothetical protein